MDNREVLFRAENICKQFNGVQVLKNVSLEIKKGEIHALMGENGAGKSTIIKIITGVYTKDSGELYMDGEKITVHSRQDARKAGISVIYQELSLIPAMTITENVFLGQEIMKRGLPDMKAMHRRVKELIDYYGFDLAPNDVVGTLGMAKRQMTEILKALSMNAKLLIMDEPTASLSVGESEKLFDAMSQLREKGTSILYISHRLEEVYRMADRLTVMRDGENVGVLEKEAITPNIVTSMMIGRELKSEQRSFKRDEEVCLEVKDLDYMQLLRNINFKAYGGEILGIGGLVGSGRTELISCIYGLAKPSRGSITLNGRKVSGSIHENIKNGFGFVPEDRHNEGLFPLHTVSKNLIASSIDKISSFVFTIRRKESRIAKNSIEQYDIRPQMAWLPVSNLSGGNQQKVVLGRWLSRDLKVLLLDEPTAGVDIGVKDDLYKLMRDMADAGGIIIMVSSDIEELVNVSDRILIMYRGHLFEEFSRENSSQKSVVMALSGVHTEEGVPLQ